MAFSFLTQELAIDLGTANTVIFQNDKIVLDEPSIVAIDQNTSKPIAFGHKARLMHERTHPNIKTIRPLKDGVIADFNAAELMIRGFVKMINSKRSLFSPSLKMVVCIPSGSTEVEIRAVRDSSEHAGGRDVYIIYEPMAAALGIGLDVESPSGHMVVDIGGGTTEIAVISLGGIVCKESIRVAGDVFTAEIQQYMRQQHNIRIGEITAELIKKYAPQGDYSVFLCGPQAMYTFVDKEIATLGLRKKFIRHELFGEYFNPAKEADYPANVAPEFKITVRIAGTEQMIPAPADTSILRSLEAAGIAAPAHCRSGECGWCHSKLVSGEVYCPKSVDGRREADFLYGYIHPCCSFPLSDLTIEVPPVKK